MKTLIERSYEAIVNRGLITPNTKREDFIKKAKEELVEVENEYLSLRFGEGSKQRYIEEMTDLATVCIMQIHDLGHNFIDEFEKVVIKNETRND